MVEPAMRTTLLHLALVAAIACIAQPALARAAKNGAIALQRDSGRFGYAADALTSRAAKLEALKQCADPRCEVVVTFTNACGALARNPARRAEKDIFPPLARCARKRKPKRCACAQPKTASWSPGPARGWPFNVR